MEEVGEVDAAGHGRPSVSLRRWTLILLLLIFNLIDVGITRAVLAAGGEESNPLMRSLIDDVGAALAVKVGVCLAVGVLLMYAPARSRLAEGAVAGVIVFYVIVAGWNIGILISQFPRG